MSNTFSTIIGFSLFTLALIWMLKGMSWGESWQWAAKKIAIGYLWAGLVFSSLYFIAKGTVE